MWRRGRQAAVRIARIAAYALAWAAAVFAAALLLYLLMAAVLGLIPANADWRQPERGITIYVSTNGVHTDILVPTVTDVIDWRPYAPAQDFADPRYGASNYIGFGYGSRDFFLHTRTWSDLTVGTALGALFGGGPALLHVEYVPDPRAGEDQRAIRLTRDQYAALAAFIRARFRPDSAGRTLPLRGQGYGPNDMFYEANGGYSFIFTCNEWTGRALRTAGVRMGLWTPLSQGVMGRLAGETN